MIDYETLHEQAKWAEYKLAHPQLKSKIGEGLPELKNDIILWGVRFFGQKGKQIYEILYTEMQDD